MFGTTGKAVELAKKASQQLVAWASGHTVDMKNGTCGLSSLFLGYNHLCANERFSRCANNAATSAKVAAVPPAQKAKMGVADN